MESYMHGGLVAITTLSMPVGTSVPTTNVNIIDSDTSSPTTNIGTFTFNSSVDAFRPLWSSSGQTPEPVALLSDIGAVNAPWAPNSTTQTVVFTQASSLDTTNVTLMSQPTLVPLTPMMGSLLADFVLTFPSFPSLTVDGYRSTFILNSTALPSWITASNMNASGAVIDLTDGTVIGLCWLNFVPSTNTWTLYFTTNVGLAPIPTIPVIGLNFNAVVKYAA